MSFTDYLLSRSDELTAEAIGQVVLVAAAVVLAALIGVLVGMATYRWTALNATAIAIAGVFLTIPSLALLGLLIAPLGLGFQPALVALVMYGLLPIIRNTVVGLRGVDAPIVDSARGMGMSPTRVLVTVELPLAWPVILTGIRVSTQILMGIAAVAAYVQGPGLGKQIFDGLSNLGGVNSLNQVVVGTVGIVILALLFDLFYILIGRLTVSRGVRVAT
jgi:osmoprotectant transport system permease protein